MEKAQSLSYSDSIFEAREKLGIPGTVNGSETPFPRKPHKTHNNLSLGKITKNRVSLSSSQVRFTGWRRPLKEWKAWVDSLRPKYQSVWDQAGIHEAIMFSVRETTTKRNSDKALILGLSEHWNPKTNTFVFPWGESTLTLTDMSVMFGLSVTGESVSVSVSTQNDDDFDIKELRNALFLPGTGRTGRAWMTRFMGTGSPVEHVAFLSLWLTHHVFPTERYYVLPHRHVIAAAASLARGIRIALARPVLAGLYQDLRALRLRGRPTTTTTTTTTDTVMVTAPFQYLHFWASQRGLGSSDKAFVWCPYSCTGEDSEPITHTLRSSWLMGLDGSMELYSPHRVLRQFGLPCHVACASFATWQGVGVGRARDTVRRPRKPFLASNDNEGTRVFGLFLNSSTMEVRSEFDPFKSVEKTNSTREEEDNVVESVMALNNNNVEEVDKDCGVGDFDSTEKSDSVEDDLKNEVILIGDDEETNDFDKLVYRISRLERVISELKRRRCNENV